MKKERTTKLFFILLASVIIILSSSKITTVNQASFFLPAESIVKKGSFVIDDSHELTIDKIKVDDHFYSSKPPVPYFLMAIIYYPLYNYLNLQFPNYENYYFSPNILVYVFTLIFVGLPLFILALFFYKTLLLIKVETKNSLLLTAGLIFSTLCFSYAFSFNRHIAPTMAFYVGFYYLLLNKINRPHYKYFLLSGLFFALGTVFELPIGFLLLFLTGLFILYKYNFRYLLFFYGSACILIALHFYLNFLIVGDILPIQLHKNLYLYTDSYWLNPAAIDQPENNPFMYILNVLIGPKGFFISSPLLLLSFAGIIKIIKNKHNLLHSEAILFLISFLILILYYAFFIKLYPGTSVGYRWLLPLLPNAYLFTYIYFIGQTNKIIKYIFFCLLIAGFFTNLIFIGNPWV